MIGRRMRRGFTLIEVTLVLAIAGLIFLAMLVALPALQRAGRNAQREDYIEMVLEKIRKFQTNNRGALPGSGGETTVEVGSVSGADAASWGGFYRDYLGENFTDPSGPAYRLHVIPCGGNVAGGACGEAVAAATEDGFREDWTIYIITQAKCTGAEGVVATGNPRKVAALYRLEQGGVFCANT